MENAGSTIAREICNIDIKTKKAVVLCGTGNNGGDGFVIARHLINNGWQVKTIIIGGQNKLKNDALVNYNILKKMQGNIQIIEQPEKDLLSRELFDCTVIVDALLGTGFSGRLSDNYTLVINEINKSKKIIVAVDIPSGLNSESGFFDNTCIKADFTVTLQMAKIGLIINDGPEMCGKLVVKDISIPIQAITQVGINTNLTDAEYIIDSIIPRKNNTHKGSFGKTLVIGSSKGMTGSGVMSACAALRSGAGLVVLGLPQSIQAAANTIMPEIMTKGYFDNNEGFYKKECIYDMLESINSSASLVIGPGISEDEDIKEIIVEIVKNCRIPMVIDADGLNSLAKEKNVLKEKKSSIIVTPHPGEMARLIGTTTDEIQRNRVKYASKFSSEFGVITVLKGFRTVIALPDGSVFINPTGNPGMATAGTGDVLAGLIGGLISQGIPAEKAAVAGVYIHGAAGDMAIDEIGEAGLVATDIIKFIPKILKNIIDAQRGE